VKHHAAGDLEVLPAEFGQSREPLGVPVPLPGVAPMMGSLEVDADEVVTPSHVDDSDQDAIVVQHRYLCLQWRNPFITNNNRVSDSHGDSAPASTKLSVWRSCFRPRSPGCRAATDSMSLTLTSVAFISASMRWIPASSSRRRPMSNAVRAGVVSAAPSMFCVSPIARSSVWTRSFGGGRRLVWINSAGCRGSTQFAPNIA
jgi:hypothetical protein